MRLQIAEYFDAMDKSRDRVNTHNWAWVSGSVRVVYSIE